MGTHGEHGELDRMVASALQVNGRASWGAIARALEVPERTVVRRGQRLLDAGLVRVSTYLDTTIVGQAHPLVIRLTTRSGTAMAVGRTLADRADASSVSVLEGSGDVACMLLPRSPDDSARLQLSELPAIDGVVSTEASTVLRYFRSGYDWFVGDLPPSAIDALQPKLYEEGPPNPSVELTEDDEALVAALEADGRATVVALARSLGVSAPTVRRRLESLFAVGALHVRTEVSPTLHNLRVEALTWLRVPPDQIEKIGTSLGRHPAVRFCVACTGSSQILVDCLVPHEFALYSFLTQDVGSHGAVTISRTSVVLAALRRGPMVLADY